MSSLQGTYGRNVDPPGEYHTLMADSRAELLLWIWRNLKPTKVKVCPSLPTASSMTSRDGGFYVSNGAFKGAMLEAGYEPVDLRERNWRFRCTRARAT
jgi:hypothetical protein